MGNATGLLVLVLVDDDEDETFLPAGCCLSTRKSSNASMSSSDSVSEDISCRSTTFMSL